MNAEAWRVGARRVSRRLIVTAALLVGAGFAQAAKDTPLGVELVPSNMPVPTVNDAVRSLSLISQIGSHASRIWHWGDPSALEFIRSTFALTPQYGLKTVLQMGTIFLGSPAPPAGLPQTFNDPATKARFLADVRILAEMRPNYLVLTTEANLMHRFNRAEFDFYRPLYEEAYHLVKTISPNTKVGVSYLYSLWFANYYIDDIDVPALLAPADFVAFTDYPEWLVREGHYPNIASIPPEWYGASRLAYPDKLIIFSEIGWASKVRGTPQIQSEFLTNLPRLMATTQPHLLTWALLHDAEYFSRDLLTPEATAFLESIPVDIDALFGHFNGMGLLDGFSNPKLGYYTASQLVFNQP